MTDQTKSTASDSLNNPLSHPLCMTRIDVVLKLLCREKGLQKKSMSQILAALGMGIATGPAAALEIALNHSKIRKESVQQPVFITGHWRSGTTLIQYLLAQDKAFGTYFPLFNGTYTYYFLMGKVFEKTVASMVQGTRPIDNMRLSLDLPLEEYMSFAKTEADAYYQINAFPQSFRHYMDMIYWQDLPPKKAEKLKAKYEYLLKKLSLANDHKQLMLKSPDNTARVGILHEMFPDAKFFNIYRNPYEVIRSSVHMYETTFRMWALQETPSRDELEDWVIDNFKRMYETFFAVIPTLPAGSFYEVRFEDFVKDPLRYLKEAYDVLQLGDFEQAKPGFEAYLEAEKDYVKNKFDYPLSLKNKIEEKLGFYFEHYGYIPGVLSGGNQD